MLRELLKRGRRPLILSLMIIKGQLRQQRPDRLLLILAVPMIPKPPQSSKDLTLFVHFFALIASAYL